ncbi:MAG: hypothetical protein MUO26_00035 [Methanotrichaceae archaeon]|nr:hypothetical protein [Methanotrichaceae archaeon]
MIRKIFISRLIAIIIFFSSLLMNIALSNQEDPILSANQILNVSDDSLESIIVQYPAFVLDCYKNGCGPCEDMSAVLSEMAEDFSWGS